MYHLWEAARLGPMTLKNRTIRSATNEHLSESDGQLTGAWADALIELAQNEVGLIISGHMTVERTQRSDEGQPVVDGETSLALLTLAADGVHEFGGRLLIQLSHSGVKANAQVNGTAAKAPADFSLHELDVLVERFVFAARLCQKAGMDGVQIHTAHGYLLSNFLNPSENSRADAYGGGLENRFALVKRILKAVRAACGAEFALLVKADANGCGDLSGLLRLYEQTGVDGIEISGIDFAARAGQRQPFYLEELLAARRGVSLPIFLVGGVFSLKTAQELLQAEIPFVSFSRALICQPDFIARMKAGECEESLCAACNQCYQIYRKKPCRCVLHSEPIPQLSKVFGC